MPKKIRIELFLDMNIQEDIIIYNFIKLSGNKIKSELSSLISNKPTAENNSLNLQLQALNDKIDKLKNYIENFKFLSYNKEEKKEDTKEEGDGLDSFFQGMKNSEFF